MLFHTAGDIQCLAPTQVIDTWPEALAVLAAPQHAPLGLQLLGETVDEIWHLAGDASVDGSWCVLGLDTSSAVGAEAAAASSSSERGWSSACGRHVEVAVRWPQVQHQWTPCWKQRTLQLARYDS